MALNPIARLGRIYYEGFRDSPLSRRLLALVLIKLFVMFAILRVFFFPDLLGGLSDGQRAERVTDALTEGFPAPVSTQTERPCP